jgi:hypothetical protein
MAVRACHSKLHRRLRLGGLWFQANSDEKSLQGPIPIEKKTVHGGASYHPSNGRKHNKKVMVQTGPGKKETLSPK